MRAARRGLRFRQLPKTRVHPPLAVVEPLTPEEVEAIPADLAAERKDFTFADPRRADHRKEVAAPLRGNTDAHLAHPDDVFDVAIVLLDLHGGKDQRAFVVDVDRGAHIGRR